MSIKLIATDLDGTLMSPDHLTITEYTLDTLREAHDIGVKIALVTGRPLSLTESVIEQIPFCDYVVYANGACVFDRNEGRVIFSRLISNSKSREIISFFLTQKVFFEVYIDGESHYQFGSEEYVDNSELPTDFINEAISLMKGHDDLLEFLGDGEIEKITLYSVRDEDYLTFKKEMERLSLVTATSFKGNLEATDSCADKGTALDGMCRVLGITSENVMSFGDAGNDIPMLEFAEFSFAMENGTEDCKKSAKYIAKSNAADGLAQAVRKYVLNKA